MSTHSQPRHWDLSWSHIPVSRKTEKHARQALVKLPGRAPKDKVKYAKLYWSGDVRATWPDLQTEVRRGRDVGILSGQSGLVFVDCDVKHTDATFEGQGNTRRLIPGATLSGLDDLHRVAAEHGETVPETYVIQTPSGGTHLYFRQNPGQEVSTKHHRRGWTIDVIAGQNLWVAAPPTQGYEVASDREVAELPLWLAQFIQGVNQRLLPVGGQRQQALLDAAREARSAVKVGTTGSLLDRWVRAELDVVAFAQEIRRGWNLAIFQCSCNLFEYGYAYEDVKKAVLDVAEPDNDHEADKAIDTIDSAWDRKKGGYAL
ncbi:bifunctional DNA primase/polymerase [Streptomyces olivochromogenes]|uniref:DNA primase/polymerase bifunctional N-terminal domain-containing protein n=1 Tax=Streptomyces olivochromogenes TaxID=1963 RepID=A0A250VFT1_STROL|nr:bifunctional DNA primase/polymerase [Streptomyces olivochromogenes]GAX52840.1 hypothetical protein SO3561_04359 [Streptomyces olivochromogenes]